MTGATPMLDSILWLAGAAIALLGAALAVWAIWWDRARGRRRCPQCWYDMGGVPGMTCPECGRTVTTEKRLARTRRRWAWATAGTVLLLAGFVSTQVPAYRQGGWVGLVPSSILIYWAPAEQLSLGAPQVAGLLMQTPGFAPPPPAPLPPRFGLTTGEKLTAEAWSRLRNDRLWGWQARIYVNRYLNKAGDDMPWDVRFLDRWPVGEPVRAAVSRLPAHASLTSFLTLELWLGETPDGTREPKSEWYGSEVYLLAGTPSLGDANTVHMRGRVGNTIVFERSWPLPCTIVESKFDMVDAVGDPEFTALVRAALDPSVAEQDGRLVLVVNDRANQEPWPSLDAAIVFEGEVLVDGEVVARSGTFWIERLRPVWKNWLDGPMEWLPGGRERLDAGRDRAMLRVRASPGGAASFFLAAPFSYPNFACWSGEFTVPARWGPVERPRPAAGNP